MIKEIIAGIIVFCALFGLIYSTISYWELRATIKECNKELGVGNWTFTEERNMIYDKFSCKSYHQDSFVTSQMIITSTQSCSINGKEINCSEMGGIVKNG